MIDAFVGVGEVADKFSVSKHTVRQWLHKGKIPEDLYVKIGNTYRYNLQGIEKLFLNNNRDYKCGTDFDVKEFKESEGYKKLQDVGMLDEDF